MYLCSIFVNNTFPNFTGQSEKTLWNIKKDIKSLIPVSCLIHCALQQGRRKGSESVVTFSRTQQNT